MPQDDVTTVHLKDGTTLHLKGRNLSPDAVAQKVSAFRGAQPEKAKPVPGAPGGTPPAVPPPPNPMKPDTRGTARTMAEDVFQPRSTDLPQQKPGESQEDWIKRRKEAYNEGGQLLAATMALEAAHNPVGLAKGLARGAVGTYGGAGIGERAVGVFTKDPDARAAGATVGGIVGGAWGMFSPSAKTLLSPKNFVQWAKALTNPRKLGADFLRGILEGGEGAEAGATTARPPKGMIVDPDSPPPDVAVTYQSKSREWLFKEASKGDVLAGKELLRSGDKDLPPNFKFLIEETAKRVAHRNYPPGKIIP